MGRYIDKKKSVNNKKQAYNYLVNNKGMAPHVAAGIIGNLMQESGHSLSTKAYNPDDLGSPSYGLAQWRGSRLEALKKYAGDNISKLNTQLDFLVHELNTTESRAMSKLKTSSNAEEAAIMVSKYYERPHKDYAHNDKRATNAKSVYLEFNDSGTYAKESNGKIVVLNPEVVTEEDKKASPAIKREFYEANFNIPNVRTKQPEPAPIIEAKKEILNTTKEVEFKNKLGEILSNMQPIQAETQGDISHYNPSKVNLNTPENEFYSSFTPQAADGGSINPTRGSSRPTVSKESTAVNKPGIPKALTNKLVTDKEVESILENANFNNNTIEEPEVVKSRSNLISLERAANKRAFRVGDRGEDVKNIQAFLIENGFMDSRSSRGVSNLDGAFGNITKRAIEKYQKENKLTVDGVLGKNTLQSIQSKSFNKKDNEVLINPKFANSTNTKNNTYIHKEGIPKKVNENHLTLIRKGLNTIPLMARAFIHDSFGGEAPITEQQLNEGEMKSLKDAVRHSLTLKSNRITYDTWRAVGAGGEDTRTDDVNFLNPAVSLQKTLGQASIVKEENGDIYVVDTYNFNDAGDIKNRNKNKYTDERGLLPLTEATSLSNGIYRIARNYKTEFGKAKGGSPSKILVGNIKDFI